MKSIYDRSKEELLHGKSTAPGRVRTFILHPEQRTTPHSCTRYQWNGDLAELITFAARALKGGSGVKVTFGTDTKLVEPRDLGDWRVWIDPNHPEWESMQKHEIVQKESPYEQTRSVWQIQDSIEGDFGILDSWQKLIYPGQWDSDWDTVTIDLSNIRPAGTQNSNGLIASGAESFLSIYAAIAKYLETGTIESLIKLLGTLNSVMRRGGYKKGIITSAMSTECDLIRDYLRVPTIEIEGSHKKGVSFYESAFDDLELMELIEHSRNTESTFITLPGSDEELDWNVCIALMLAHKGTCLIWRNNLGLCEIHEIPDVMEQAALDACELHTTWRDRVPELAVYYAPLEQDRQIGLCVMGLANLLAIEGVTYLEFADALDFMLNLTRSSKEKMSYDLNPKAVDIAFAINNGYERARWAADNYMLSKRLPLLDRIFTVEPAQSHAYETFDRVGKTTCRGIFPPTGRIVKRASDSQVNRRYFHGNIETDVMVGPELHERICDLWQTMMDRTGRAHGISQDTWQPTTTESLKKLVKRPSKGLYYDETANYNQRGFLAKTVQDVEVCEIERKDECRACAG